MYHDYYPELVAALKEDNAAQVIYLVFKSDFKVSPRVLDEVCRVQNFSARTFIDCLKEHHVSIDDDVMQAFLLHYDSSTHFFSLFPTAYAQNVERGIAFASPW